MAKQTSEMKAFKATFTKFDGRPILVENLTKRDGVKISDDGKTVAEVEYSAESRVYNDDPKMREAVEAEMRKNSDYPKDIWKSLVSQVNATLKASARAEGQNKKAKDLGLEKPKKDSKVWAFRNLLNTLTGQKNPQTGENFTDAEIANFVKMMTGYATEDEARAADEKIAADKAAAEEQEESAEVSA